MSTEGRPFAAANRVYEDIELPSSAAEWVQEEGYDTLIVNLQGYKKENLRIQVTSTRNIRVLGERPVGPENKTWQRFRKEFPVPSNCEVNETSARFDKGSLYVKIPRIIAPVETVANKDQKPQNKAATGTPAPPESVPKPRKPTGTSTTYAPQTAAASAQTNFNNAAAEEQTTAANKEKKTDASSKVNSGSQAKHANNSASAAATDKPSKVSTSEEAAEASANRDSKKTSMEKQKSDVVSATAQNATTEDVNRGKRVDEEYSSTKEDGSTEKYCSTRTKGRGYYRQVVDGLIMELKEPRKLVNVAVAFGLVLVLGLYVKYAINSIQEFRQEL